MRDEISVAIDRDGAGRVRFAMQSVRQTVQRVPCTRPEAQVMKKITLFAVFAALTMLSTASAIAQDAPAPAATPAPARAGGDATTYDFDDDLVTGDLVRPDGELLNVRRRGQRNSLIRIREHFIPEMLKSVENL